MRANTKNRIAHLFDALAASDRTGGDNGEVVRMPASTRIEATRTDGIIKQCLVAVLRHNATRMEHQELPSVLPLSVERSAGCTPLVLWQEGIASFGLPSQGGLESNSVGIRLLPRAEATMLAGRVLFRGVTYAIVDRSPIGTGHGQKTVTVAYAPKDLSAIHLLDLEGLSVVRAVCQGAGPTAHVKAASPSRRS